MLARQFVVALPPGIPTPALQHALSTTIPALVIYQWRELAKDHVDTGDYLARLTLQDALRYPFEGDEDAVAVLNTAEHADWIENGRAGFHLPSRWGARGGKWHYGKNGPYAYVPFRIYTPMQAGGGASSKRARLGNTMPKAVYQRAKGVRGGGRLDGFGDQYKQSKSYVYYRAAGMGGTPDADSYTWVASQFEGLFAAVQQTPGAPQHAEYMTIRTIKPDSPGWYIPPTPAHRFGERAVENVAPLIADIVDRASAEDLTNALLDATGGLL